MLDRRLPNNERIKVVNNATAGHRSPSPAEIEETSAPIAYGRV